MNKIIFALCSLFIVSSTTQAMGNGGPAGVSVPFYMNVGGEELISSALFGREKYATDTGGYRGSASSSVTDDRPGISDALVFETWRGNKNGLRWRIPIANGTYDLTLMYQESYWGVKKGKCTSAGSIRQFDVIVGGVQVRDEFDICKKAGAPLTGIRDVIRNVFVSNGFMDIELSPGEGRDPKPQLAGMVITTAARPTNNARLSWTAPITRTDSSSLPLSEIAGYRVYHGTSADNLSMITDIQNGALTSYTARNLAKGTHYFAVTVYDINNKESAYSTIEKKTIN